MIKNIILVGLGGHGKSCMSVIEKLKNIKICGYVDKKKKNSNLKYLGSDKSLKNIRKKFVNALIGIGQIKNHKRRLVVFKKLKKLKFNLPAIKSKSSIISHDTKIGEGSIIMEKVFINTNVLIGENCIINSGSIIEHDVIIGDNCHISTGVIINGNVVIEDNTFIGSGTIINNQTKIKKNSVIPSGSLLKNLYEKK